MANFCEEEDDWEALADKDEKEEVGSALLVGCYVIIPAYLNCFVV